jgi:hypothetical protein
VEVPHLVGQIGKVRQLPQPPCQVRLPLPTLSLLCPSLSVMSISRRLASIFQIGSDIDIAALKVFHATNF